MLETGRSLNYALPNRLTKLPDSRQPLLRAGGRPLTRLDDFDFDFLWGGLPFAVFAKGGLPRRLRPI
jgi:hypothetical protein